MPFTRRSGCSFGTRPPGVRRLNIIVCGFGVPRLTSSDAALLPRDTAGRHSPPHGQSQQSARCAGHASPTGGRPSPRGQSPSPPPRRTYLLQHQIHHPGLKFRAEATPLPPLLLPLPSTTTSEVSREADEAQYQASRSCLIFRRSSRALCTAILRSPKPLALHHSRKHSTHVQPSE